MDKVLQPGARIDRYGSDYGSFTSLEGTPYEMRAVAPVTDQRPYSVFEVVEPINVKSGSIASWFDEPGGGIQYLLPDTVDELLDWDILWLKEVEQYAKYQTYFRFAKLHRRNSRYAGL